MQSQTFVITGQDFLEPISTFVRHYHQVAHESSYQGGFIRLYEDYSFLAGNDLMICIRLDAAAALEGKVLIEFIAGGGSGYPFFRNLFTRNNSRIRHFRNQLEAFCISEGLAMSG